MTSHLGSIREESRLLVVLFDSLSVKVDCARVVSRLKGFVALVFEFDSIHFVKSSRSSSRRQRKRWKMRGGGVVV